MSPSQTTDRTVWERLRWAWKRMTWPVWNYRHDRLRAPLRALLPLVGTFLALGIFQTAVRARFEHPVRELLELVGLAGILVAGIVVSARAVDRRPITEYGLSADRGWWRSLAVGGIVGTVVNAGALAVSLRAGWVSIVGYAHAPGVLPFVPATLVAFALVSVAAAWEEFVFRATMLKNLAEGGERFLERWSTVLLALLLSSLVFAALHGGKVEQFSQYGYYLLAGVVLGGVYVLTGELAVPIGFHTFYNYTMGLFGLGVSQSGPELVVLDLVGPDRWVGEEGLVHVVFAAVGGLLLLSYIRWREGNLSLHHGVTRWTPLGESAASSDEDE